MFLFALPAEMSKFKYFIIISLDWLIVLEEIWLLDAPIFGEEPSNFHMW